MALSGAVAEAEWLQMPFMDVTKGGLLTEHWRDSVGPFTAVLRQDCKLNADPLENINIVDAKGIFDTLDKETSGSKADRRIAIDLAVIRTVMTRVGSHIRWVPHPAMPVDPLTKSDIQKGNMAQFKMLSSGMLRLAAEADSLRDREDRAAGRDRSRAFSGKHLAKLHGETPGRG